MLDLEALGKRIQRVGLMKRVQSKRGSGKGVEHLSFRKEKVVAIAAVKKKDILPHKTENEGVNWLKNNFLSYVSDFPWAK